MKAEVYRIFNDIQTRTNTIDNLESFTKTFEKNNITKFNEVVENVFLIIFKNYDKNNVVLKNIKEFVKMFLERIVKSTKKDQTKNFINHFCKLFTENVKKHKYKTLCIYFINIFLIPYSNNYESFYHSETLERIKNFILNILKGKQTSLHFAVLKLLQKHTILQKEKDVWERLENLLNNSTQVIKKEILKLLEIDNQNILNYLLEMYDDDSVEIRHFVFEKLSEIKNFKLINGNIKVQLFYTGLSDNSQRVQQSAKKFLKNFLYSIGIYKSKKANNDKMDVDEEAVLNLQSMNCNNISSASKSKKQKKEESEDEDEEKNETIHDKIEKSNSPMVRHKKKLLDSPSRIFDELDIISFYNHPKYSYCFQLITEAIIEFTDSENLIEFLRNIIDNMILVSKSQSEIKFLSPRKKSNDVAMSYSSAGKYHKQAMFNDIYFLQNCIKFIGNKLDESSATLKNSVFELLPDNKTFAHILNFYYSGGTDIMILHQLFLIGFHLHYEDEIGNREMITVLKKFIGDITLDSYTIRGNSFRKLDFNNNILTQPDQITEFNNQEIDEVSLMIKEMENILLPSTRRIILSMDDMVEYALKILLKIHYNEHNQLFTSVMESVNEISEPLEGDKEKQGVLPPLKARQKELIENIKDKMAEIGNLEERKKKDRNRINLDVQINTKKQELNKYDDELFQITRDEENILLRKLKLCEFLIKYCKLPVNMFETMTHTIILPTLQRKEFPEVMKLSYNAMGLLAINFFNSNYKNFLKLFIDKIETFNPEFKEFEMVSLFIIFDSILQHNVNDLAFMEGKVHEKIDMIIKKYLYHPNDIPRVIAFTGLCKLLIANRIARPEFVLARMITVLYKSFDLNDRKNEDFHIKIFEIMQNFLYVYCYTNKNHIKNVVKAVLIILTSHMLGESNLYDRSVATDFMETKVEFLNQFLMIVQDFAQGRATMKKIIFKIFKYLYFTYTYASGDLDKAVEQENELKLQTKKIDLKYKSKTNVKNNLKKFFDKTKYDMFLLNEMADESAYLKLFPFILCLNDFNSTKFFSDNLANHMNTLKENNFVYDYSGRKMDLGNEERQNELRDYVRNKEMKYYKLIEDHYEFITSLKESKLDAIQEENSKIYDDDENPMNDGSVLLNKNKRAVRAPKTSNKKNNKSINNISNITTKTNKSTSNVMLEEDNDENEDKGNSVINTSRISNKRNTKSPSKSPVKKGFKRSSSSTDNRKRINKRKK